MTTVANNPAHRSIASLKVPITVSAFITYAENIVTRMTGNPAFASPTPTLSQITAAITALSAAEGSTLTRVKGAVATRNTARTALHTLLVELKGYVQNIANANPESSASIIEGSGMSVRKATVRRPRVFNATPGPVAGSATLLTATVARRASYEWEYSLDGGKTWVSAPPSLQTKTIVTGLPSGTAVQFKGRAVTKVGAGDWSPAVTLSVR